MECLRLIVEQPDSLEIAAVSPVMEIVGGQELTLAEQAEIASGMMALTTSLMERPDIFNVTNPCTASLMERQLRVNAMLSSPAMHSHGTDVTGYKVAVDYTCVIAACGRYCSRHWFFFSPDKRIIYKSLEVPQL